MRRPHSVLTTQVFSKSTVVKRRYVLQQSEWPTKELWWGSRRMAKRQRLAQRRRVSLVCLLCRAHLLRILIFTKATWSQLPTGEPMAVRRDLRGGNEKPIGDCGVQRGERCSKPRSKSSMRSMIVYRISIAFSWPLACSTVGLLVI